MKIIIIGAGELGQLVAAKLCAVHHDVVVIDSQSEELDKIRNTLDALVLEGSGIETKLLREAGAAHTDVFLALSGDEATNILACRIASKLGAKQTICRVYSNGLFSEEDGLTPKFLGIDYAFSSVAESVEQIHTVLANRILLERIRFSNPDAHISVVHVPLNSVIAGVQIKDLPCPELLSQIRIAAVVRNRELIVPHGTTELHPGDRLYVAGRTAAVGGFVKWLANEGNTPISRVVVSGATLAGELLLTELIAQKYDIRVIESDRAKAEHLLEKLPPGVMMIDGDPTDADVITEAGVPGCDAFVALTDKDENNILSCLLASRLGARKSVALTGKAEYISILPALERIGCWFNSTQIAANTVFRLMEGETMHVDSELGNVDARLVECRVTRKSELVGRTILACKLPQNLIIALILRGDEVISPNGSTELAAGDVMIAIADPATIRQLRERL